MQRNEVMPIASMFTFIQVLSGSCCHRPIFHSFYILQVLQRENKLLNPCCVNVTLLHKTNTQHLVLMRAGKSCELSNHPSPPPSFVLLCFVHSPVWNTPSDLCLKDTYLYANLPGVKLILTQEARDKCIYTLPPLVAL